MTSLSSLSQRKLRNGICFSAVWGYFLVALLGSLLAAQIGAGQKATKLFKCPQQFGYFADMEDCNKYFMCVFGDALHDKCTPGLYFNSELRMCDWPRNVKTCESGQKSSATSSEGRRQFGTSTIRPRSSDSNRSQQSSQPRNNNIPSYNSIAPPDPTQDTRTGSRYTPPINSDSYMAAARNSSNIRAAPSFIKPTIRASTTPTPKPRPYTYGPPASFKPVQYRITTKTPLIRIPQNSREALRPNSRSTHTSNKRKDYDDTEYYDEEYEDDDEEDTSVEELNQNLRNGNNAYVRPINPTTVPITQIQSTFNRDSNSRIPPRNAITGPAAPNSYNSRFRNGNSNSGRNTVSEPNSSRNTNIRPSYISFNNRGRNLNTNSGGLNSVIDSSASRSSEEDRKVFGNQQNRNTNSNRQYGSSGNPTRDANPPSIPYNQRNRASANTNSALSSTYTTRSRDSDSLIRLRPQSNRPSVQSQQSLDNGGDSLDAQFGTNPRAISLPDSPYRLNSFTSNSDARKAERNQQHLNKPPVTSTRYHAPARPSYQQGQSQGYDDYPEYYYDEDDEDYEDEDDISIQKPVPKVVIRVQKPSTTSTTNRPTSPSTTTRRTTTTTRKPPTTRPASRPLPFGISRPATKSPPRFGPKPLPPLPSRPQPLYTTPRALVQADKCTAQKCVLPDCRCGGHDIPGGLPANQVPQIVLITFDDAVNDLNYELYTEIFETRKNPNGCPILGTFYVSHEWTDYGMVQSLYSKGHEMASHSITHSHGEKFSVNQWIKEIHGQREILHLYGGVKLEDIRGMRAPFLQVGGNSMFEALHEANFTYDSSMPVLDNNPPFYPYTLDYSINHECMIPPCPTKSFPGLWEVGMVMWNDYRGGRCSMGDACANPDNAEDVYKMLLKNFNRHYNSNRAPFGLYYHAAWFTTQHFRKGFLKFIDDVNSKNDVYMVTNWQALQWMREPTPLSHIKSFQPWQCPKAADKPGTCNHPTTCNISYKGGNRNMRTCQPCPSNYPWTGRTGFDEVYG